MKKYFTSGLVLLFMIALSFVFVPTKAVVLDDDVGISITYVMPENQTSVDVIFITEGLTTMSYDMGLQNEDYKYTDLDVMLQNSQMNNFSTGDVAVNLGLRSASKTTSFNLMTQSILTPQIPNSQREYRLDIGESSSQVREVTRHII